MSVPSPTRLPEPSSPRSAPVRRRLTTLRSGRDIQAVFAARDAVRGRLVTVHVRRDDDERRTGRVAIVAGRRVGSAVQRNRAKRRLREIVRMDGVPTGLDVVLTAGPATPTAPFDRLRDDVRAATARALRPRQPR